MLMFSMYPDAKIIYREYVQNAFDSINSAVEQKILNKTKDGIVSIKIDPNLRNISIRDMVPESLLIMLPPYSQASQILQKME